MANLHNDLREVMGLLENYCIAKARKSYATSDEYQRFKNASADFMLAHGPALLARQEGEDDSA